MPSCNNWRFIEVGRVVLLKDSKYENKIAVVLDVLDMNRVLVDSPACGSKWTGVPRHVVTMKNLEATPVKVDTTRGAKVTTLTKAIKEQGIVAAWDSSMWAKKISIRDARTNITDFDRVRLDRARRTRAYTLRKSLAEKLTKAGKVNKAKKVFTA
eukprot:TRINITY_DN181_c0_g1_i2.p1 TRINITY_DN181_c0_g1~~TRINITY_DN181_c0_g1_i2.p1  ORF type:complete len:155 (+),score=83.29 TRINITY_DN181_c0_g1_i2:56-520(+)